MRNFYTKYENCILPLLVVLFNIALMGICFDFYYDLNDDTMMKDIMSGVYSGTPDGHNMQTLYVLGALISLGYRLCRAVPWYGLFLCLCQFGCVYLTGVRLMGLCRHRKGKAVLLLLLSAFQWSVCLPHLVNIQYTITCALMSAAAIFWFVTTPKGLSVKRFVINNIPAVVLVILAYQLRTEMLLLTFPFIGLAGLVRWAEEEKIFTKEAFQKYGIVLGVMLAGMLISGGIDRAAYGSAEWKEFQNFFKARTTVYDFYPELITEDSYGEALGKIGVTEQQQALLRNYNFGLDEFIDEPLLTAVADYATDVTGSAKDRTGIFKKQFRAYVYRTFHGQDAPYNIIVLWAYAAVFSGGCICLSKEASGIQSKGKKYAFVWQLLLLAVMRSAVWMFIMMRGRDPERITHSLYFVEFALLAAMLVKMLYAKPVRWAECVAALSFLMITLFFSKDAVSGLKFDQEQRETVNKDWRGIDEYCRARYENFYFEDVYSTVGFSQKIFTDNFPDYANYDIIGGWMCKSPLYYEKLERYHITQADKALLEGDNVFLIISDAEATDRGFDWITEYYAAQNLPVNVRQADRINENYAVYRIEKK